MANLDSISTMGSTAFLLIFAAVNYANYRLRAETGSSGILAILGIVLCALWRSEPSSTTRSRRRR